MTGRGGGSAGGDEDEAAIEQANGVLVVLYGVSANRAFEVLVAQSQTRNIRVAAIAAEVVETLTKQ